MNLSIIPQVIKWHAKRGPSNSIRWTLCHASYQREQVSPRAREGNAAADMGTVMHDLAEHCLRDGPEGYGYMELRRNARAVVTSDGVVLYGPPGTSFYPEGHVVDEPMIDAAQRYIDFVRDLAMGGELMVEQHLSIEHITGEPGAKGTSDSVIIFPDEICIVDLKGGFKRVFASYEFKGDLFEYGPESLRMQAFTSDVRFPNPQLVMYAEATRQEYAQKGPFKRVRMIICQPRLGHVDEYTLGMETFAIWVQWIREQSAATLLPTPRVVPGEKQCEYCAVFPCAEAEGEALRTAFGDFEYIEQVTEPKLPPVRSLGAAKRALPLVEMWCRWVDQQVYTELKSGNPVDGFKLVLGDQGDRAWHDPEMALLEMRAAGLKDDEIFQRKVKSPAQLEGSVKKSRSRSPDRTVPVHVWEAVQPHISRAPPSPKVVPSSDPRLAWVNDEADAFFDDSPTGDDANFFKGL